MMDRLLVWNPAAQAFEESHIEDGPWHEPWWWYKGESAYWPPTNELLDELTDSMRIAPTMGAVIGPRLSGPAGEQAEGTYVRDYALAACVGTGSPVATLLHELYHAVRPRLSPEDRWILEAHGQAVRQAYPGPVKLRRWLAQDGEAEAWAFDRWCMGQDAAGIRPSAGVRAIWRRIRDGAYA